MDTGSLRGMLTWLRTNLAFASPIHHLNESDSLFIPSWALPARKTAAKNKMVEETLRAVPCLFEGKEEDVSVDAGTLRKPLLQAAPVSRVARAGS